MAMLTWFVEKHIANVLPETFSLVFDGWSHTCMHYAAIFVLFPESFPEQFRTILFSMSPLEEDKTMGATEHEKLLDFVLSVFKKSKSNVVFIIRDNVSTNKKLSRAIYFGFIGCGSASHRLNLSVSEMITEYNYLVLKV